MDNDIKDIKKLHLLGASYLREYGYKNSDKIYKFMKTYDIGESAYGALMDAAAEGKHVMAHRLFGHHIIYNFPIDEPEKIYSFLEHELSDLFTKQGLPIIPGEIIKNKNLLSYCDKLTNNWNFINGFDLLAGTIAIYQGGKKLIAAYNEEFSIDSLSELARNIGVGVLELALSLSSANPFLLIGSVLQLCAGIKGIMNDSAVIYMAKINYNLTVEFALDNLSVNQALYEISVEKALHDISVLKALDDLSPGSFLRK